MISANQEDEEEFQPIVNPYIPYCFSSVESLLSHTLLVIVSGIKKVIPSGMTRQFMVTIIHRHNILSLIQFIDTTTHRQNNS